MHQNYRRNLLKIPEGAGALPRFGGCGADDGKCVSKSWDAAVSKSPDAAGAVGPGKPRLA